MRIVKLRCSEETEAHIGSRHNLSFREVEEAAYQHELAIRGREPDVYEIYGRTEAGRYLMIAVRRLGKGIARLITARDMSETERARYRKHVSQ